MIEIPNRVKFKSSACYKTGLKEKYVGPPIPPEYCKLCEHGPTKRGHDFCIKNLPGVIHACCGHGDRPAYIVFETGHVIRGQFDHMANAEME